MFAHKSRYQSTRNRSDLPNRAGGQRARGIWLWTASAGVETGTLRLRTASTGRRPQPLKPGAEAGAETSMAGPAGTNSTPDRTDRPVRSGSLDPAVAKCRHRRGEGLRGSLHPRGMMRRGHQSGARRRQRSIGAHCGLAAGRRPVHSVPNLARSLRRTGLRSGQGAGPNRGQRLGCGAAPSAGPGRQLGRRALQPQVDVHHVHPAAAALARPAARAPAGSFGVPATAGRGGVLRRRDQL